jgi:hypothetical protein
MTQRFCDNGQAATLCPNGANNLTVVNGMNYTCCASNYCNALSVAASRYLSSTTNVFTILASVVLASLTTVSLTI